MDYWRPKTYHSPPEEFTAGDYLAGALLVIAFIVMLVVLAVAQLVPSWRARTRGGADSAH